MNITDIVKFERTPESYVRIEPFTATIHHTGLSIAEKSIIQSALANAGHEIRRRRCDDRPDSFREVSP